jgi:hypothetical protein
MLRRLRRLKGADFEAVDVSSLIEDPQLGYGAWQRSSAGTIARAS